MQRPEDAPSCLTLRLFGPFDVYVEGQPPARLHSRKEQWLLALLTLRHNREISREWLAGTLWPDSVESQARDYLRHALTGLRRTLGSQAYRLSAPTVHTLRLDLSGASADVIAFDAAIASAERPSLESAVALYRGPLLEGCTEEWALTARIEREQAYLAALEILAGHATEQGQPTTAVRYLRLTIAADPLREAAHAALMQALSDCGDYAAVTQVYRDLRLLLHREINAAPSPETDALYRRLQQAKQVTAPIAADVPASTRRLPVPLTSLIGREQDIAGIVNLLRQRRLVTLVGSGGVGKTRLAIAAAEALAPDFAEGVWFVELSALTAPTLVAQTVARTLGVKEEVGRTLEETLIEALASRSLLLILDNCEHLLEACAHLAKTLLGGCAQLRILATSRQALDIVGGERYPVSPLPLPAMRHSLTPETSLRSEAVQLFVARARAVRPSFALDASNANSVGKICKKLDGLPLAIELAAAQLLVQSVAQIEARLDDRFQLLTHGSRNNDRRQQTLQAMVDWSYDLLSPEEQRLFRYLAVFAGSFSLEAVEAVCAGEGAPPAQMLDLLYQLVWKSMVGDEDQGETVRFRLLETLWLYGREKLRHHEEEEMLRGRHLDYFLRLSEQAAPGFKGPQETVWYDYVEREHDNVRAALAWAVHQEDTREKALRMAGALWLFWEVRGYQSEGRAWLAGAPEDSRRIAPSVHANALLGAGTLALRQGDYETAETCLQEALLLWRELNQPSNIAITSFNLAIVAYHRGDYTEARSAWQTNLSLRREWGDVVGAADALLWLGNTAHCEGNYAEAQQLWEESMTLYQEQNYPIRAVYILNNLAVLAHDQEEIPRSLSLYEQSLALYRQAGDRAGIASTLNNLGNVRREQGDGMEARQLLEESLVIRRELEDAVGIPLTLNTLGLAHCTLGEYAEAQRCFIESAVLYIERQDREGLAYAFTGLADVCVGEGDPAWAARLLGAAESLRAAQGTSLAPAEHRDWNRSVSAIRAKLRETELADAWAEGADLSWQELLARRGAPSAADSR